ncbi:peptidoglycan bridge formation glycyltransferase FemA/FemB family protein [Candidatus Saccharibacteria bacterium]|nr:peptidoglycan bridge formation glycyltransferase FemA/FemB family protein [Candidatus Saccharibacteria bacterium]
MNNLFTATPAKDREEWDNFITSDPTSNFLQSWDFYEFHASRGNQIVRKLFRDQNNKIVAAYAGVVETARRGKHLAIAGGPNLDCKNKSLVKAVFKDIKNEGKNAGCVFVRVRPQLPLSDSSLKLFSSLGLKKAPMYLSVEYAGVLDLEKSEAEILQNASQGFRRKLRKAEKNDVQISVSKDPKDIKDFYKIQLETAKRNKFYAFSESFLEKQFAAFAKNDEALLFIAKTSDHQILAENFMIFYGTEASYHYGVSSDLGTKYSAAPLLHIEAMREARRRHITRYNLWGIVGPDEKHHRFYGVSEFKRSFGCSELKYTPAHDLVLDPKKYLLTKLIESARKKLRHV